MGRHPLFPNSNTLPVNERRTIILAPTGRDAELISGLLERMDMPCHVVPSVAALCDEIRIGAGAAILAEESLNRGAMAQLVTVLQTQPTWSDFPVILLTVGGRVTAESLRLRELRRPLGNMFLLERPIRPETLLTTLDIALRGRQRQYQIRNQMARYAQSQEALRRSEKLAVTGRLAASIAHEINNPLEAVTNLLYLIRCDPDPARITAYLDQADQELARVTEITKQTLRFYREPSQPVETNVGAVLDSVLVLYHSRLVAAGVTVQREVTTDNINVLSSPGELRQIIANLIGNAVDAMRRGGRLRLRLSKEYYSKHNATEWTRLTIADTGCGIPRALLSSIFEPFVTTKGETGTGLGLWVTAEIVKKNGWIMRVRSSCDPPGQGTVFSLLIPVMKQADRQGSAIAVAAQS